jgi:anti-anti-sigma factor
MDAFGELILDLAGNDNIDSTGVTFVISVYKRTKERQKHFRVIGASSDVQMLFKLMKLDQFFELSD